MEILTRNLAFICLNVVGGSAVLGSYAWGFLQRPEQAQLLWGKVPNSLRPIYIVSMVLAAVGYFVFTGFLLARLEPGSTVLPGGHGWGVVSFLYGVILLASALWMPLTFRYLTAPGSGAWILIRLTLGIVGTASVALLIILIGSGIDKSGWLYPAAMAGLIAFCFQTAILDGLVWPHYF